MCACVCHSLPIPGLAGSLLRRGRVPNVAFQPQNPRFSKPHSFAHSEHQPKECAGSRKEKERKETSRPPQLRPQHARGTGFNPQPVHAHVRLRLSQFAYPWSCRQPAPPGAYNVLFQPQKLRFSRFSRPHSFVHSEHQPKECAGSRKDKERKETSRPAQLRGSHHTRSACERDLSMPMCACVCHSLPIPGLSPFGFAASCQGRLPLASASTNQRIAPAACSAAAGRLTSRSSHKTRAFPGRTRLSTASTSQRSAPAAERKRKEKKPLGLLS